MPCKHCGNDFTLLRPWHIWLLSVDCKTACESKSELLCPCSLITSLIFFYVHVIIETEVNKNFWLHLQTSQEMKNGAVRGVDWLENWEKRSFFASHPLEHIFQVMLSRSLRGAEGEILPSQAGLLGDVTCQAHSLQQLKGTLKLPCPGHSSWPLASCWSLAPSHPTVSWCREQCWFSAPVEKQSHPKVNKCCPFYQCRKAS